MRVASGRLATHATFLRHRIATTRKRVHSGWRSARRTRDAANVSFADRLRNAGRPGGRRDHWGLGGAALTVLNLRREAFQNSRAITAIAPTSPASNKENFGLRQSGRQLNRGNGKSQCELFIALWDREKVAFITWRKIAAVRLTKNPVQ
jgi:hypothetical protein